MTSRYTAQFFTPAINSHHSSIAPQASTTKHFDFHPISRIFTQRNRQVTEPPPPRWAKSPLPFRPFKDTWLTKATIGLSGSRIC